VYLGNPPTLKPSGGSDARRFNELYSLASCDLQERADKLLTPRSSWQPHFLSDPGARIDVPALRFTNPAYDRRSMSLLRLDRLEAALDDGSTREAECPGEKPWLAFVDSLATDPDRRAAIRADFEAADRTIAVDDGIVRAFGSNMETIREPDNLDGWQQFFDFMYPEVRRFLAAIVEMEASR